MSKKVSKNEEKSKKTTKTAKIKPKNKYNPQGIDEVIWAYLPEWIQQSDKYNPTIKGLLAVLMSLDVAFEGKKDEDGFFFRSSENLDKDCAMAGLYINSEYRGRVIGLMKKMGLIDHEAGWRNKNAKKGQCSRFKILVGEELNQTHQVPDKQGISKEHIHLNNKYKNNNNFNSNFNKKENVNSNYNQKENYNSNDNQNENVKSNDKDKINSNPNQNDKDNFNMKYNQKQKEISNQKEYTNANDNTDALREAVPFKNREEFNRYSNHTWSAMEPQDPTSSKLVEDDYYHHPWLNDDEPDALPF